MTDKQQIIASVSFGKDSLAMLLKCLELNMRIDEVVFVDTGMEFQSRTDRLMKKSKRYIEWINNR